MNPTAVRLISALIPSRKARHAFRDRHAAPKTKPAGDSFAAMDKRLKDIEAQLNLLVHFCFQKEICPEFGQKLRVGFPAEDATLAQLIGHSWANSGVGSSVKSQYISEQISLAAAMIHILPDDELFRIFRKIAELCIPGSPNSNAVLGHWNWVLWRTGKHEGNLRLMEEFFPAGTEIPPHIFRRFIASAQSAGRDGLARQLMRKYHKKFLTKELWKSYTTAKLSAELGMRDAEIDFVCSVGDEITENARAGTLEKMLKGKRVAIVGNGPQEVGSGHGEKIDACDVVIRFNDFPENPEFRRDYGSKTNIWVRSLWVEAPHRKSIPDVIVGEALHSEYPNLKIMRDVAGMRPAHIFAIPAEIYYEVHAYGVNHPTNGTLTLAWIKKLCPALSAEDCYGFSFKDEIVPKALTHYYDSPSLQKGTAHNLNKERAFLRELFGLKGD